MENEKFKGTQRDLLVEVAKDISYLKEQLKDLSCQTMAKLTDHDRRIDCLEQKQTVGNVAIAIGIIAVIALIYHLTGYRV